MVFKLRANPTIGDLQAPFEFTYADSHAKTSWYTTCNAIQVIVDYFGKDRLPEMIYRHQVAEFLKFLADKRGYKPTTIKRIRQVGSSFYTFLQYHEIIQMGINPFKKLVLPKRMKPQNVQFERY